MARILGIDLGTTNSCAAFVSNGIPRIVPIEGGFSTIPSTVALQHSGAILVGQAAKEETARGPERVIYAVKRLLGRQFSSKVVQDLKRRMPYQIVAGDGGEAAVSVGGKVYAAVQIQALLLQQMKRYAEINLGEDIPEVVIAVPAYYSDHQRTLVKQAGSLAGWKVRRVVNEPTAAALAYGFNRGFDQRILIYDIGGGTFDVSILELTGNVFQVIATGGDTFLGGTDFDNRILDWLCAQIRKVYKVDVSQDAVGMEQLRGAAERAKIELSLLGNTRVRLQLGDRRSKPLSIELVLDRDTINSLTRDLVERTLQVTDQVLHDRHISKQDITEIILVGGQTRMPQVSDMLTAHFGKAPRKGVHPDECVALGAALLADSLAKIDSVTLLETVRVPIGIAQDDGSVLVVVHKHALLPHQASTVLPTTTDNQAELALDIYQGELGPIEQAEYLGTLYYKDIPPAAAGAVRITVDFAMDVEGMLTITAYDSRSKTPRTMTLETVERRQTAGAIAEVQAAELNAPGANSPQPPSRLKGFVRSIIGK